MRIKSDRLPVKKTWLGRRMEGIAGLWTGRGRTIKVHSLIEFSNSSTLLFIPIHRLENMKITLRERPYDFFFFSFGTPKRRQGKVEKCIYILYIYVRLLIR